MPPSSLTVSEAASTEPTEEPALALVEAPEPYIRYAESDAEICAIHRFLLVVAQPALQCEVDVEKSLNEIVRVAKEGAAIMVMHGDMLVGSLGLMSVTWWYGNKDFMTDRWHFVLPAFDHSPTSKLLEDDAKQIANAVGLPFVHNGKLRARGGILRKMPIIYLPPRE